MPQASRATRAPALKPRALVPGSRVALVAPAGPLDAARIARSTERCRMEGLEPVVAPSAAGRYRYMAGTDAERLADLQSAFDDRSIDAIWALRGGYGTLRLVDDLDLGRQREDPIPFIGFSDNTAIHALHTELGVVSFHGPHPGGDFPAETEEAFRRVLFGTSAPGRVGPREGDPRPRALVPGSVEAPLVGGNLAILASLCGTPHALDATGSILFLEDVGEPAYRVDRMLLQLCRAGTTDGVLGLALGRFAERGDDEEGHTDALLEEFAGRLGVPAVTDLPFGHVDHNVTLPVGGLARLDADAATLELTEAAVTPA